MMDDETITALAAGMAPFVRECVADAVFNIGLDQQVVMLPPELAVEVASAARMLHELPPIVSRETPAAARVTRIERDENGALVPVYGEPQP
jgi:hypothetical protein